MQGTLALHNELYSWSQSLGQESSHGPRVVVVDVDDSNVVVDVVVMGAIEVVVQHQG